MSSKNVVTERPEVERKVGHYRAYDADGVVIWEQKEFCAGIDCIPLGISICMRSASIKQGNKVIHRWDPWGMLP